MTTENFFYILVRIVVKFEETEMNENNIKSLKNRKKSVVVIFLKKSHFFDICLFFIFLRYFDLSYCFRTYLFCKEKLWGC